MRVGYLPHRTQLGAFIQGFLCVNQHLRIIFHVSVNAAQVSVGHHHSEGTSNLFRHAEKLGVPFDGLLVILGVMERQPEVVANGQQLVVDAHRLHAPEQLFVDNLRILIPL